MTPHEEMFNTRDDFDEPTGFDAGWLILAASIIGFIIIAIVIAGRM